MICIKVLILTYEVVVSCMKILMHSLFKVNKLNA